MKEYLEAQIKEKDKEAEKWNKITAICFFGTMVIWVLLFAIVFFFPHLKERFLDFLRQKDASSIMTLSLIPIITVVAISVIPFIHYARKSLEIGKLEKQLKKFKTGEVSE